MPSDKDYVLRVFWRPLLAQQHHIIRHIWRRLIEVALCVIHIRLRCVIKDNAHRQQTLPVIRHRGAFMIVTASTSLATSVRRWAYVVLAACTRRLMMASERRRRSNAIK